MTYSLTNKCAKNYNNRALIVQVIAENVVTCFFFETQCINNAQNTTVETRMMHTCVIVYRCISVENSFLLQSVTYSIILH